MEKSNGIRSCTCRVDNHSSQWCDVLDLPTSRDSSGLYTGDWPTLKEQHSTGKYNVKFELTEQYTGPTMFKNSVATASVLSGILHGLKQGIIRPNSVYCVRV